MLLSRCLSVLPVTAGMILIPVILSLVTARSSRGTSGRALSLTVFAYLSAMTTVSAMTCAGIIPAPVFFAVLAGSVIGSAVAFIMNSYLNPCL